MTSKLLIKLPRMVRVEDQQRDVLLSPLEIHHVSNVTIDYHTKYGIVPANSFMKPDGTAIVVGKETFVVLSPTAHDQWRNLGHSTAVITKKDVGALLLNLGLDKNSVVIEAGSGGGSLACGLGLFVREVHSLDIGEAQVHEARRNAAAVGLTNVHFAVGNIYEAGPSVEPADALILDVPEPWNAWGTAKKVVKIGGRIAAYTPQVLQAREFVVNMPAEFLYERSIEIIEREWAIDSKRTRPVTKDFGHSAFLTFARRIS